jgi:hypothetical protein
VPVVGQHVREAEPAGVHAARLAQRADAATIRLAPGPARTG